MFLVFVLFVSKLVAHAGAGEYYVPGSQADGAYTLTCGYVGMEKRRARGRGNGWSFHWRAIDGLYLAEGLAARESAGTRMNDAASAGVDGIGPPPRWH